MQTDLLKLAKTPEEKIGMQNLIDFKKITTDLEDSVLQIIRKK